MLQTDEDHGSFEETGAFICWSCEEFYENYYMPLTKFTSIYDNEIDLEDTCPDCCAHALIDNLPKEVVDALKENLK